MLVNCPSCNTEYDCEPGRYRCSCGAEFTVPAEKRTASAVRIDDPDVTIPPHHTHSHASQEATDVTMPGRRERKPDGRFEVGDLILGRYKVLSVLGRGGMGMVYKCFDETAGIMVALKALPPELAQSELEMEDVKENFQLVHGLRHPNIAGYNTLEKDSSNGNYYLIMECVEGEDLRRWIKRKRRENALTLETVLPIIRQVAAALDYAHGKRIVHRDIKPGNIMIDAEGQVSVLDFGLAAQIHTSMTRVSMVSQETGGTAPYMAPEQWRGKAQGAAADQYALAVMTYEMLSGHLPFESPDSTVLREAVLNEMPDPVEGLPEYAQAALLRGMAKIPGDRFGSCVEFAAALGEEGNISAANPVIRTTPSVISEAEKHTPVQDQGNRTISLPGNMKLELVKVEAGSFEMSAKDGENFDDEVAHRATLTKDFYIGRTEVTQAQWTAVMGSNPSCFKGDDLPVETVSWNDAMEFCWKLNDSGKAPNGWKFTLPTETQWEYAARGGKKSKGYKYSGSDKADDVAWYYENSGDSRLDDSSWTVDKVDSNHCKTHPVGQKKANELGLYDMSGNVYEWCLDGWNSDSSKLTAEFTRGNNQSGSSRVDRGGSWDFSARGCRSANRDHRDSGHRDSDLGFRVALVPAEGYGSGSEAAPATTTRQKTSTGQTASSLSGDTAQQAQVPPGDKTIVLPGNVKLELVKVEAGSFEMSAKDGENESDEVAHWATLTKDFYIGRTEVTQAQWKAVMGTTPSTYEGDDLLPVEKVSWNDAMEFCEKLNRMGKAPSGWMFTLPTETQWEYAARGGKKSKGYKYSGSDDIGEVAWYSSNSGFTTHPARQKKANELGLYDMSGNVWEWCLDDWSSDSSELTDEFTRDNDRDGLFRVLRGGSSRVIRGGGWSSLAGDCRSACRFSLGPGDRDDDLGFRVALVPKSY